MYRPIDIWKKYKNNINSYPHPLALFRGRRHQRTTVVAHFLLPFETHACRLVAQTCPTVFFLSVFQVQKFFSFVHPTPLHPWKSNRKKRESWPYSSLYFHIKSKYNNTCSYTFNLQCYIGACMFIVLSVLDVTQRVPPTCITKTSRTW